MAEKGETTARIALPPKLIPVFAGGADVRGAYGGRGSGKTRSFAKMTAVRAYMWDQEGRSGQVLCGRQFMNSLADSSLEEVKLAILEEPWLAANFDIGEKYVKTRSGRIYYTFSGLDRNIDSIKSKSRILLGWVDEAEPVTDTAWTKLIPTLREEDSELWVTWNPESKKSATHKRFRETRDPRYRIVEVNWRDNPRFPAKLERDRLRDLRERPDEYDHIWEGAFATITEGAILGRLLAETTRNGHINDDVAFDPDGPGIEVSSDIGFRDTSTWWFWQRRVGGFAVLRVDAGSGLDAEEWTVRLREILEERGWPIQKIWLPHDARTRTFAAKHSTIETFIKAFGESKCAIVPQTSKTDRINAARTVVRKCEFHATDCDEGLDGLRAWKYEWNDDTRSFSKEPLHDWASHFGDGYSYGCQVMAALAAPVARPNVLGTDPLGKPIVEKPRPKVLTEMTYNEFLATAEKRRERV